MSSRFVAAFRDEVQAWNRKLNAVADVVQLMAEIQRSWACERAALQGCRFRCALNSAVFIPTL
jgi:hypothetical protein